VRNERMLTDGTFFEAEANVHLERGEPVKVAQYLAQCARKFLQGEQPHVLPALKCLFASLSIVLPAPIEADLRLFAGTTLLDYTRNGREALEQLQKAYQLALHASGGIGFAQRCRIVRSLVDALVRTESLGLAHSVLDRMILECLNLGSETGTGASVFDSEAWNWCMHFALLSLQLKLEQGTRQLPQVLVDLDELLELIARKQRDYADDSEALGLLRASKVLCLSFLVLVLMKEREIVSVFQALPKAVFELNECLADLERGQQANKAELELGVCVLGRVLVFVHAVSLGASEAIAMQYKALAAAFAAFQAHCEELELPFVRLPGLLIFLSCGELELLLRFCRLVSDRFDASVSFETLMEGIDRVQAELKANAASPFAEPLSVSADAFRRSIELSSTRAVGHFPQTVPSKMHEVLLLLTAHGLMPRFGREKVSSFYEQKRTSFVAVDTRAFVAMNRAMVSDGKDMEGALACDDLRLDWSMAQCHLCIAVSLHQGASPAHVIRPHLDSALELVSRLSDPQLAAAAHLLKAEFESSTDLDAALDHAQKAAFLSAHRLGNSKWTEIASDLIGKLS
jgi:hypothetical protein